MEKLFDTRYDRARKILDDVANQIICGGAVKYIRSNLEMFTEGNELPCQNWSKLNRLLVSLNDTNDARGIRQWHETGRHVKKGCSAFYIFVPLFKTEKEDATKTEEKVLSGFRLMPVFRVEDTEGKELMYQTRMKNLDLEKLPLIDVAKKLGVKVQKGLTGDAAGSYNLSSKTITMSSSNPQVFLHELSHAVDHALGNYDSDYAFGEVVAELSSAFLGSFYGVNVDMTNTKAYIEGWSSKEHVVFKILSALSRVEEIYHYIDKAKSETVKEKKQVKKKEKTLEKCGSNYVLPFKTKDFNDRTQIYNTKTGKWVKRDSETGLFTAVKKDGKPWSRVKIEEMQTASCHIPDYPPAS